MFEKVFCRKLSEKFIRILHNYGFHRNITTARTLVTRHPNLKSFFQEVYQYGDKTALVDQHGTYSYKDLLRQSQAVARHLHPALDHANRVKEARVATLCRHDATYVASMWGCWMAGGIFVPLSPAYPKTELEYFISDSKCSAVLTTKDLLPKLESVIQEKGLQVIQLDHLLTDTSLQPTSDEKKILTEEIKNLCADNCQDRDAMIIYTSGTTGPPKGVVLTHANLQVRFYIL